MDTIEQMEETIQIIEILISPGDIIAKKTQDITNVYNAYMEMVDFYRVFTTPETEEDYLVFLDFYVNFHSADDATAVQSMKDDIETLKYIVSPSQRTTTLDSMIQNSRFKPFHAKLRALLWDELLKMSVKQNSAFWSS
jgi:hypothetical protein